MVQLFRNIRSKIITLIDWFYFPVFRFIPPEVFRYAFTGGVNTAFDLFLYFIVYRYKISI